MNEFEVVSVLDLPVNIFNSINAAFKPVHVLYILYRHTDIVLYFVKTNCFVFWLVELTVMFIIIFRKQSKSRFRFVNCKLHIRTEKSCKQKRLKLLSDTAHQNVFKRSIIKPLFLYSLAFVFFLL